MIVACIEPGGGSLDAFAADPYKTAALKPAVLDAVRAFLAARPADPGVAGRLMTVRAAADARSEQVAGLAGRDQLEKAMAGLLD